MSPPLGGGVGHPVQTNQCVCSQGDDVAANAIAGLFVLLNHVWQRGMRAVHGGVEVLVDGLNNLLFGIVLVRIAPDRSANDDDERIDTPPLLHGMVDKVMAAVPATIVANMDAGLFADALNVLGGLLSDVLGPVADHDGCAFCSQASNGGQTNALTGAGNHADLALKAPCATGQGIERFLFHCHSSLLIISGFRRTTSAIVPGGLQKSKVVGV